MSSDPKPPKPLPSAEEINAYLELSAARTKKRLTLAAGNARPRAEGAPADRKLPLGRATAQANDEVTAPAPARAAAAAEEGSWRPFSDEDER